MESVTLERPTVGKEASPAVQKTTNLRVWFHDAVIKGHRKVFTERVRVTPQLAQLILENNPSNRKLSGPKMAQLKEDMNKGRFKGLNGETIIIAKTGELNDGQHRLNAVFETNQPQEMLLLFGVERNTRDTIDTGKNRTPGDVLTMGNHLHGMQLAATARMVLSYERNNKAFIGRTGDISPAAVIERARIDTLLQECNGYAANHVNKLRRFAKITLIGFLLYEFTVATNNKIAMTFMEKFRTGENLPSNSPIFLVREYLTTRPKLSTMDRLEVITKAWNAWLKDQEIKLFKLTGTLPKIEGTAKTVLPENAQVKG